MCLDALRAGDVKIKESFDNNDNIDNNSKMEKKSKN